MNVETRTKMVKAMEFIARQINDEMVFDSWLCNGVADEDIEYGDLSSENEASDYSDFGYYINDKQFADLMETFLDCMKAAKKSGGLYCDWITSKHEYE